MASAVPPLHLSADLCPDPPRILTFVDHYYPGYKGGGPIRTVENLVEHLGAQFEFRIVTGDRDLGDDAPYPGVPLDRWVRTQRGLVYYTPRHQQTSTYWRRRLHEWDFDAIYLNSLFSRTSIRILMLRRLGALPPRPLLLAPRGQLALAALGLKRAKKLAFLKAACASGLFRGVIWQAATPREHRDIVRTFRELGAPDVHEVCTAANLTGRGEMGEYLARRGASSRAPTDKAPGALRCAFVGRICRMKNLDFVLSLLGEVRGRVELDVFGPIEDRRYWQECEGLIAHVGDSARVVYRGELKGPAAVIERLATHHALLVPSRSENFGHVILESLVAGCPVMVSDQTPWRGLAAARAGWDLPLANPGAFIACLQRLVDMDQEEFTTWSAGAHALGVASVRNVPAVEANRQLLQHCATDSTTCVGASGGMPGLGHSMPAPSNPT